MAMSKPRKLKFQSYYDTFRRIYHYLDALIPESNLHCGFLSVYVHFRYYVGQEDIRAAQMSYNFQHCWSKSK